MRYRSKPFGSALPRFKDLVSHINPITEDEDKTFIGEKDQVFVQKK